MDKYVHHFFVKNSIFDVSYGRIDQRPWNQLQVVWRLLLHIYQVLTFRKVASTSQYLKNSYFLSWRWCIWHPHPNFTILCLQWCITMLCMHATHCWGSPSRVALLCEQPLTNSVLSYIRIGSKSSSCHKPTPHQRYLAFLASCDNLIQFFMLISMQYRYLSKDNTTRRLYSV